MKTIDPVAALPSVVAAVAAVSGAKYALVVQNCPFGGDASVRVIAVGKKQKDVEVGNVDVNYDTNGDPLLPHVWLDGDKKKTPVYFEGVVYSVKGVK